MRRRLDQVSVWVGARLGDIAVVCYHRSHRVLTVGGFLAALALVIAAHRLTLNADLAELLPKSFQSVQDLEVLKERFGGVGYVAVVGQRASPEVLERFAQEVAPQLEALPAVRFVDYRRPTRFFEDRALYFLDLEDLRSLHDRIVERVGWEKRVNNPIYLDLEQSEPPAVDFSDLHSRYNRRGDTSWIRTQLGEAYYLDRKQKLIVLLCKPASLSMDLAFTRELVDQVKQLVGGLDRSRYPGLTVAFAGNFTKKVDQHEMIMRDLKVATSVAAVLMVLFLILHFRRVAAVALIMGPLIAGLLWTHGFAALAFGSLNILTGFIGAILLGLGIDHGIHLLGRYDCEMASEPHGEAAVRKAFAHTGRAVVVAALTTTVGFAGLGLSEFRAFREFGIIAGAGMLLLVTAYLTVLPALLRIVGHRSRGKRGELATGWARWIAAPRAGKVLVASVLAVGVSVGYGMPRARFNYDFRALVASDLPSFRMDRLVDRLLGYSQTPVVVLAENQEQERRFAAALRARQKERGEASTIDFVAAGADMVPLEQQAKRQLLRSLAQQIDGVKARWLPEELRPLFVQLRRAVATPPFTAADWPIEVQRQFRGADGVAGEGFVLVFPGVDLSHGARVSEFAAELRGVTLSSGERVVASGEPLILADIFDMVAREAPRVLLLTLLFIFATMALLLGSLRQAVICLLPAVLTLAGTIGLLGMTDLDLNYVNIVMIPVLFGIAVDGGVHLVTRTAEGGIESAVTNTGRAIGGAILTTAFGFGALLLADHKGLESLGQLALLGLAMNLLCSLVVLSALLAWRPHLAAHQRGGAT